MKSVWGCTLFTGVTKTCKVVINPSQCTIMPLVANPAVVGMDECHLEDHDICEPAQDNKTFDAVLFDILQIPAEDIANQLTLIDLPLFQAITPDELTCCEWTGKKKLDLCPNVVRFVKRFNQVSFWVTKEILDNNTAKIRADIVTYFIRVAKKLLDLNNLNSLKAVVSSLHSAPIHRLTQTWHLVHKREKEKLEKLQDLISEDSNNRMLRDHLSSVRLPCIPYLGMYLTDLTYIDTIHPCTGGLDKQRTEKMNEILRIIADFQHSEYDELVEIGYIQNYLTELKYIDELQKFLEDEHYKISQQIEPNTTVLNDKPTKDSASTTNAAASESHELLFPPPFRKSARHPPKNLSRTFRSPSPDKKQYTPGHRKAKSLGSHQQFLQAFDVHGAVTPSLSYSPAESKYNLVDDSPVVDPNGTTNSCDSDQDESEPHPIVWNIERRSSGVYNFSSDLDFIVEGFLKRKTLLKNGYKPSVATWRRFWVGLRPSKGHLVYYLPKHTGFGGQDRVNFRPELHKVVPLSGWTVFLVPQSDSFKLTDGSGHTVYHFRAGCPKNADIWYTNIKVAADGEKSKEPKNLIDFGDGVDRTVIRDTRL